MLLPETRAARIGSGCTVMTDVTGTDPAPEGGPQRVVVGVDGSPSSRDALLWALAAAARSQARVEVVSAYPVDFYWTDPYLIDTRHVSDVRTKTAERTRSFVDDARRDPSLATVPGVADVDVEVVVVGGAPAEHLVARGEGARVLVVGSRGRGTVRTALLGSVALHCATHAHCPVVVVHGAPLQQPARVVVGLDDSPVSRAVVERAAEEAHLLGAELDAVAVYPTLVDWAVGYETAVPMGDDVQDRARAGAEELLGEVLGANGGAQLHVLEDDPRHGLVARAEGAALLVVGSRSRNTLAGTVLGSVALHCAVHAPCPVMVVRPGPAPGAVGAAGREPAASGSA